MRRPKLKSDDRLRVVKQWLTQLRDDGVPRARRWLANRVLYPLYERTLPSPRRLSYYAWQDALREAYYRRLDVTRTLDRSDRQDAWREAIRSTILCYGECPVAPHATEVRGDR